MSTEPTAHPADDLDPVEPASIDPHPGSVDGHPASRATEVIAPGPMRELRDHAASIGSLRPPAPPTAASSPGVARQRRRRAAPFVVALAVLALLTVGLAARGTDDGPGTATSSPPRDRQPAGDVVDDGTVIAAEVDGGARPGFALGDETGAGVDELERIEIGDEWPAPGGGGAGASLPELPPAPPPSPPQPDGGEVGQPPAPDGGDAPPTEPPADPCAGLEAGAHLVTTPDPVHLRPGLLSSSLTIRNCGSEPVNWVAATKPSVHLDDDGDTLAGGAEHQLGFTIDASAFATDAIAFKIKVSEPGFNQYVDVSATKAVLADAGSQPPDPGGTITTGGPVGCAASCITRAWLTPNATSPDLGLDVETSTPARVAVFVSTAAPVAGPDGQPSFPEGGLIAATDDLGLAWSATLHPLVAATDYHIVVRATDADGGVSNRVGTFRTPTPAVDPDLDAAAPGGGSGCATQCITKAWLTPDPTSFDMGLEVTSHTLARFEASLSTEAPTTDGDGNPVFAGGAAVTTNGAYETSWTTTLTPLEPETSYHLIVKATDGMFRSSYQVGSFETRPGADRLLVSFHRILVHHDGDRGANRGELSFVFAVGGVHVGSTGERKVGSGSTVELDDGDRWPGISTVVDVDPSPSGWLPLLEVVGKERDADGLVEFCGGGDVVSDPGSDAGCDLTWDVASSGLIRVGAIGGLPSCPELGVDAEEVAAARCVALESPGNGDDYPRFTVIASVQLLTP